MVFSSTLFLFLFLPVTLLGYYLLKESYRNYWLLIVSLIFFGWSQMNYLWIILLNIAVNYSFAMWITKGRRTKKIALAMAVLANLLILFYFKYFNFAIDTINHIFNCRFSVKEIILPIGISFFTFQGMSYVIDVYRQQVPVQKNIFKLGVYIVLFPQLIAGPIVRYKDVAAEIDKRRTTLDDFSSGVERFIIGLGKKAIIANAMASTADAIWMNGAANNTWAVAWVGSVAYTLQIYFDFSGYSDMAIGLGRMFGFHFMENFNLPYISKSISEFWRRWHISLSSWFKDYVYIPLGGNRKNVYLNLAIVFILTGIWHGASWNFVVWGIWNGFFILAERLILNKKKNGGITKRESIFRTFLSKVYTLSVIHFGWILFRAPHIKDAVKYVLAMFGKNNGAQIGYTALWYLDRWTVTIMVLAIFFASSLPKKLGAFIRKSISESKYLIIRYILLIMVLLTSILRIVSGTYNPFIYFQF